MKEKGDIEYEVAFLSLQEETVTRLELINSVEIQFMRQFQCHVSTPQTHPALVYQMRNMIFTIQDTYLGIKDYFKDLNMEFIFALFRKIQILMVNGYSFLTQALLTHIDEAQFEKQLKTQTQERKKLLIKTDQPKHHSKERALEHCNYNINYLQSQQKRIMEEMHKIQDHLFLSKGLIERLCPSKAVKQLTQIKQQSEITLQNSEKIFQETYQLKYMEFKNYLSSIQKPEDLTKQLCDNIKVSIKDKFTDGVKKSVGTLYSLAKQQYSDTLKEEGVQTEEPEQTKAQKKAFLKPGQKLQTLILRERKFAQKLQFDIVTLRKEVQLLKVEKVKNTDKIKEFTLKYGQLQNTHEILTNLYEQKRQQIAKLMINMSSQAKNILHLRAIEARYLGTCSKNNRSVQTEPGITHNEQTQVNFDSQSEIVSLLRKNNEKFRQRVTQLQITQAKLAKRKLLVQKNDLKTMTLAVPSGQPIQRHKQLSKNSLVKSKPNFYSNKNQPSPHRTSIQMKNRNVITTFKTDNMSKSIVSFSKPSYRQMVSSKDSDCAPSVKQEFPIVSIQEQLRNQASNHCLESLEGKIGQGLVNVSVQTESVSIQSCSGNSQSQRRKFKLETETSAMNLPYSNDRFAKTLKYSTKRPQYHKNKKTQTLRGNLQKLSRFNYQQYESDSPDSDYSRHNHSRQRPDQRLHFQQLNLPEEHKPNIQKRSIFSKTQPYLLNSVKNKTENIPEVKNMTCQEEDFIVIRTNQKRLKSQTNAQEVMLTVDKMNPKKNRNPSKLLKVQDKQKTKENRKVQLNQPIHQN